MIDYNAIRDAIREYVACIVDADACGGDYANDALATMVELGLSPFALFLVQLAGFIIATVGGF